MAVLFTTAKRGEQAKCPSTDEWVNNTWRLRRGEYDSALEKKEILTPATMWMTLEDIM